MSIARMNPRTKRTMFLLLNMPTWLALIAFFAAGLVLFWGPQAAQDTYPFFVPFLAAVQAFGLIGTVQAFKWIMHYAEKAPE